MKLMIFMNFVFVVISAFAQGAPEPIRITYNPTVFAALDQMQKNESQDNSVRAKMQEREKIRLLLRQLEQSAESKDPIIVRINASEKNRKFRAQQLELLKSRLVVLDGELNPNPNSVKK